MDPEPFLERSNSRRELVVVLHGFGGSPGENDTDTADRAGRRGGMTDVRKAVRAARPDADIYTPMLPFAGWLGLLCKRRAEDIAAEQVDAINRLWQARATDGREYERILLVGHSIGSVLVRKIAVLAYGETPEAPFGPGWERFRAPQAWATKIERLVLLAGMSGGWSVTSAMDWIKSVRWSIASFLGDAFLNSRPTIFSLRKGAPFLVQIRLQWLALMRRQPRPGLMLIQLLGTIDDVVSPADTVDYAVDLENGDSFSLLEVRGTGHLNAVEMRPPVQHANGEIAPEEDRWAKFCFALSADARALSEASIPRNQMVDSLPPPPNHAVTDVIFVMHGIRDKGYWAQKMAREIKQAAALRHGQFQSVTASYGYLAMAPFAFPWVRRQKVAWLMECYTEACVQYPQARFSYVGHSNGTYLVARALRDYPAAHFYRIVFAGSVVRRDYDWCGFIRPAVAGHGRVKSVLNYVATRDWVVALFPKGMQPVRAIDLGSAGHDGFDQGSASGPVYEVEYIEGSHGAGHEEKHWSHIAEFIVNGKVPVPETSIQSPFWRAMGHLSTGILIALIMIFGGFGLLLTASIFTNPCLTMFGKAYCVGEPTSVTAALRSFAAMLYWWALYIFLTRF